MVAERFVGWWR